MKLLQSEFLTATQCTMHIAPDIARPEVWHIRVNEYHKKQSTSLFILPFSTAPAHRNLRTSYPFRQHRPLTAIVSLESKYQQIPSREDKARSIVVLSK
jgi:hypothetical protein